VKVRRSRPDLPLPARATPGSSGVDLRAALDGDLVLTPGGRAAVPTGLSVAVPEGYEIQVRPRSGLALDHGVTCLNSPGTIDSDYRGEVRVILANLGIEPVVIHPGDRIAQAVLSPVCRIDWTEVDELPPSPRSGGGFGHTGRR